jgi:hypothetical protein
MTYEPDDEGERDDLRPARGILTSITFAAALWIALGGLLALSGCASTAGPSQGVYAAAVALTAADTAALQYVILPLCGPTHPKPLCSEANVSAQIKAAAQQAHDMIKVAELAGDTATLAQANAAVGHLVEITPKVQ